MQKEKSRNSNLEWLRIVSMLLIVAHHYVDHGFEVGQAVTFNKYFLDIISLGGKVGVACFVFVSGYFMIDSTMTMKKIWRLFGSVLFYSCGFLLLFLTILPAVHSIGLKEIVKSFLPISFATYWFITYYILLMILSPYLNAFIRSLTERQLRSFLLLTVGLWSVFLTFTNANWGFNKLAWFVVLYCIAAYIKLHVRSDKKLTRINAWVLPLSSLVLVLSSFVMNFASQLTGMPVFAGFSRYFGKLNSILVLIVAVSLFLHYLYKPEKHTRAVNELAKYTLGVYLIHDNVLFRSYLWTSLLRNQAYYASPWLVLHAICSVLIVYFGATGVDVLRAKLLEPLWMKLYACIERIFEKRGVQRP